MRIHQHFVGNSLRNYNYVLACPTTRTAIAIDPLDHEWVISTLQTNDYTLAGILNTHDHDDHVEGNLPLLDHIRAQIQDTVPVYAHHEATHIPGFTQGLREGEHITIGQETLQVLDTPGHRMAHICFYFAGNAITEETPALFSGDTLFNAGVGHCRGGDVASLFESVYQKLKQLPKATRIFSGHDYIENNCRFTLDREPDNDHAQALLNQLTDHDPYNPYITTLAEEHQINAFLRLDSPSVIDQLIQDKTLDPASRDDAYQVFRALRAKRDHW